MRSLLVMLGIIALVLIVLGLVLKAVKWLIIIGLVALAVSIVMGWFNGRRSVR
ncbi:hypothetical protein OWR29_14710 [Actinoplanes sp. Pm04-4]|uniref:Uncharacterized protein n=1 Tax=Paractinoplanes pyxinae TaxID=2997416 RepID=A0ABT4AYB9_9ACTN|nr:hypothetical protein [Actinoplanes pyxinae]MCY1139248.1 hypothetical protein [Actinoplanes pyxinae]